MSRETDKLFDRLRLKGADIPPGTTLRRTHATLSQRAAGAWAWYLAGPGYRSLKIGSQLPLRLLLSTDFEIWPPDAAGEQHLDVPQAVLRAWYASRGSS